MNKLIEILRIVNMIPGLIVTAETIIKGPSLGKLKSDKVEYQIMSALEASELISDRDIVDNKRFRKGIKKIIDGIVDVINSSVWAKK